MSEQMPEEYSQDLSESKQSSSQFPNLDKYLVFFDKESSRNFFSKYSIPNPFRAQFEFACDFFKAFVNGEPLPEIPTTTFEVFHAERRHPLDAYNFMYSDDSILTPTNSKGENKSKKEWVFDLFFKYDHWGGNQKTFQQYFQIFKKVAPQHIEVVEEFLNVLKCHVGPDEQPQGKVNTPLKTPLLITSFQWLPETQETLSSNLSVPTTPVTLTVNDLNEINDSKTDVTYRLIPDDTTQIKNTLSSNLSVPTTPVTPTVDDPNETKDSKRDIAYIFVPDNSTQRLQHPQESSEISQAQWRKIFWATLIAELVIFAVPLTVAGFAELATKAKHLDNAPNLPAEIKDFFFGSSEATVVTNIGISLAVLFLIIPFIKTVFHPRPEEDVPNGQRHHLCC